jgi:hypothetical protein
LFTYEAAVPPLSHTSDASKVVEVPRSLIKSFKCVYVFGIEDNVIVVVVAVVTVFVISL